MDESYSYYKNLASKIDCLFDLIGIVDARICGLTELLMERDVIDPNSKRTEYYTKIIEEAFERIKERTKKENERVQEAEEEIREILKSIYPKENDKGGQHEFQKQID